MRPRVMEGRAIQPRHAKVGGKGSRSRSRPWKARPLGHTRSQHHDAYRVKADAWHPNTFGQCRVDVNLGLEFRFLNRSLAFSEGAETDPALRVCHT